MDLLVISSYPEKSLIHGNKTVGVGNYTKATLLSLLKTNPNFKIKVLAEVLEEKESYIENKIEVQRTWKRGNLLSQLFLFIKAASHKTKVVFFPFEMFMFGGNLSLLVLIPCLLILKISGKKLIVVLHQVLGTDISAFEKSAIKQQIFIQFKKILYSLLLVLGDKLIVFEEELKDRLAKNEKVIVIPHAVLQENVIQKSAAREKLGLDQSKKYVFYFGFLSPYKGVDKLIDIWDEHIEGTELILGGGGNPNHLNKPVYKDYIDSTFKAAQGKGILTTGFIPEEKMGCYFSAVDLVIFPYTVFMSSSGPLSHAFSYGAGVLLSTPLKVYFNSVDMREALAECGITAEEICFDLDKPIRSKILWAIHNIEKLQRFSTKMRELRSWDVIAQKYDEVLSSYEVATE